MMRALRWPLPAVLSWGLAWAAFALGRRLGLPSGMALVLALLPGLLLAVGVPGLWRRIVVALGFPLALLISGAAVLPPWAWLVVLAALLLLYPLQAWRDAPLFPTPRDALLGLPAQAPLREGAQLLDAGCGLGHGLVALRRAYPGARIEGVESSWPLALASALRCPWARVRPGDMWRRDWSGFDLVYLFQRPESMPRALAKARHEMRPGSWLVSLEFEATELQATGVLHLPDGRPLWLYRIVGDAGSA